MTAVWRVPTMPALLIFSIVLALCSHLVQGTTTMGASTAGDVTTTNAGTTKVGSTGTTQRMIMSSQDSTPSVTTTVAMTSTAQNTSMEATTQAADNTTVGTTTTMAADATTGSAASTPDGTTTASHNMTVNTENTVMATTSGTTGMADGMTNITTTGTPGTATNSTSQTAMPSTTGKMNTMITTTGTMDNMNTTTAMSSTMDNMNTTTTMSSTMDNMNITTAMSSTMGNMNTTMTGTTDTKNTTAETPGTTAGAMSTTNQTMDVTEVTTSIQTTGTPDADMNTTTPEPSGTTTSLTTGTTEVTGTMTSDTDTMNTTMISTTQANATTSMTTAATTMVPGPYSWNVTFDANCTLAMDNEDEFLQNCSNACADWLGIPENTTRCRNITCGSTNVVVEVDRAADTNNDISQKFHSLNDANPADPLTFSFGGTDFRATAADVIVAPPLPTTTVESTTIQPTTRPVPFCMIDGFEDDTACVVFLCSVIAIGLILLAVILWGIIKCCRRQNRKSFDLISDIPHISLSDYPMTTIPRPSVYQHQNDYGQVNMAYITEDEVDKGKPPLESSASSSQSSHSPGRVEDEKTTSALPLLQTDDSRNHVQPEIASPPVMSYQPRDVEEQPPPVYSPQSGTNSVVQPTGTDQAPGPYPSPTTSPVTEAKSDVPETTDDADYEVPDEGVTISFREAPTQDTPESPKVIKGEDGSVSVIVNW